MIMRNRYSHSAAAGCLPARPVYAVNAVNTQTGLGCYGYADRFYLALICI